MQAQILDCVVQSYGDYPQSDGGKLKYERGANAGKVIETVTLLVPDGSGVNEVRTMTLNPAINGSRPEAGATVHVVARVAKGYPQVFYKRSQAGEFYERVMELDKWRAEGFEVIAPPVAAKA